MSSGSLLKRIAERAAKASASSSLPSSAKVSSLHGSEDALAIGKEMRNTVVYVKDSDILESMQLMIGLIPHQEAYGSKEITIHSYGSDYVELLDLLSAGTMPLDAILYNAIGATRPEIFNVEGPVCKDASEASAMLTCNCGVFLTWIVIVITRGGNPTSVVNEQRRIPGLCVKDALDGLNVSFEHELADMCSSAALKKFPVIALVNADLSKLPSKYFKRCMLSPAGCRALRYASLSMQFEQSSLASARHAIDLRDILIAANNNANVWKKIHPLLQSSNPVQIEKFTLRMTRAIMDSLSESGRKNFVDYIQSSSMEAFKKDTAFKTITEGTKVNYNIMKNVDAAYTGITPEILASFLGI